MSPYHTWWWSPSGHNLMKEKRVTEEICLLLLLTDCDVGCLKYFIPSCFSILALLWYCLCSLRYCLCTFWCFYCSVITRRVWRVTLARVLSDMSIINSSTLFKFECLYCLSSKTLDIRLWASSHMTDIKDKFTSLYLSTQFFLLTLLMVHNLLSLVMG